MISAIKYPGGKGRKQIREIVLSKAPAHIAEFREPFCGSLGIGLAIDTSVTRWINDMDSGLISVYEALRDRPHEFISACMNIADLISAGSSGLDEKAAQKALTKELFERMRIDNAIDGKGVFRLMTKQNDI